MTSTPSPSPYAAPTALAVRPMPSPVVAALLSALGCPGLGHVYAGRLRRGLAWAAPASVMAMFGLTVRWSGNPLANLGLLFAISFCAWVGAIVDGTLVAMRSRQPRGPLLPVFVFWACVQTLSVSLALAQRPSWSKPSRSLPAR